MTRKILSIIASLLISANASAVDSGKPAVFGHLVNSSEGETLQLVNTWNNQFTFTNSRTHQVTTMFAFAVDMPRTFESGSCIAAGDLLLLDQSSMTWYCYNATSRFIETL